MGDRVTRVPQSRELVRAKRLRQALERGTPPAFVPPAVPNPVAQPFFLSWSSGEKSSGEKSPAEKALAEKSPAENPGKTNSKERNSKKPASEETLNIRRQYLEQLFQNSPTRSSSPTIPSASSASIRNFSACLATPRRRSWANLSIKSSSLPIAPPKQIGSRNASSAASPSLSKPSASRRTALCSTSPFHTLL